MAQRARSGASRAGRAPGRYGLRNAAVSLQITAARWNGQKAIHVIGTAVFSTGKLSAALASALYAGGRLMEVVAVLQRALADSERYLGPDHPMTKTLRDNLEAAKRT